MIMRCHNPLILLLLLSNSLLFAQKQGGFENYHFSNQTGIGGLIPVVHYQTKKNWYYEARYNYDEINTFSVLAGKTFTADKSLSLQLTPMAGIAAGKLKGVTIGLNIAAGKERFDVSIQSQYTCSFNTESFLFTWAETSYRISDHFFAGLTLQHTKPIYAVNSIEPGLLCGFTHKKFSVPVYLFQPFNKNRFFAVGLIWEWE